MLCNNMIYQISRDEESSNECSQCQREQEEGESHHHHHDETSSEEEQVGMESHSQPIKPQTSILLVLQEEINQLKRSNQDKDKAIRQLKYELEGRSRHNYQSLIAHKSGSIKKLQKQKETVTSPKAMMSRLYSPQLKPRPKAFLQSDSALQIALLQKQVKQLQLKLLQATTKLGEFDETMNWMEKFIISFVQMAQDLSLTYGGKMQLKGLPLRKRTKMSWKYMKELINYLIK